MYCRGRARLTSRQMSTSGVWSESSKHCNSQALQVRQPRTHTHATVFLALQGSIIVAAVVDKLWPLW